MMEESQIYCRCLFVSTRERERELPDTRSATTTAHCSVRVLSARRLSLVGGTFFWHVYVGNVGWQLARGNTKYEVCITSWVRGGKERKEKERRTINIQNTEENPKTSTWSPRDLATSQPRNKRSIKKKPSSASKLSNSL